MTAEEFNALFRAHLPEVSRFLSRRVSSDAVEDIASDLFEIAWKKRSSIPQGLELPWLYKTARYLVSNHLRKQSGRQSILDRFLEPQVAASAESVALADLELAEAWRRLSLQDTEVLTLWAMEGLEPSQIAAALGVSENAANIRLSRAKKKLQIELEKNQELGT